MSNYLLYHLKPSSFKDSTKDLELEKSGAQEDTNNKKVEQREVQHLETQEDIANYIARVLLKQYSRSRFFVSSKGKRFYAALKQKYPRTTHWFETKWHPRYLLKMTEERVKIQHYDMMLRQQGSPVRFGWIKFRIEKKLLENLEEIKELIDKNLQSTNQNLYIVLQEEAKEDE